MNVHLPSYFFFRSLCCRPDGSLQSAHFLMAWRRSERKGGRKEKEVNPPGQATRRRGRRRRKSKHSIRSMDGCGREVVGCGCGRREGREREREREGTMNQIRESPASRQLCTTYNGAGRKGRKRKGGGTHLCCAACSIRFSRLKVFFQKAQLRHRTGTHLSSPLPYSFPPPPSSTYWHEKKKSLRLARVRGKYR